VGEVDVVLADWWQEFSQASDAEREDLVVQLREEQQKHQRRARTSKPPRLPVPAAEGPLHQAAASPAPAQQRDDGPADAEGDADGNAGGGGDAPRKRRRRRRKPSGAGGESGGPAPADDGATH
jgi:poly(A) polymerase